MHGSCTSRPIKALARPLRTPWEEAPARSPDPGKCAIEESYGKVQGSAGGGRHGISGMPGGLASRRHGEPPVEGNLRQDLFGGMCHDNDCRQETTRLHAISCAKTGWSTLTHSWVPHHALARYLRESKVHLVVEDTWPFRERASGQNGRLNPLCMDMTTEAGALFDKCPRLQNKALLLDNTIANSCAGSNLGNAARHVGKHLADEVERKKNKYRGSFPATYSLLPLAMSTCGEVGSDVHTLIKELAIRRVERRTETHSNESQHLTERTEVARLRLRFSCFTVGTFIPHASPSLQTEGGTCEHPTVLCNLINTHTHTHLPLCRV